MGLIAILKSFTRVVKVESKYADTEIDPGGNALKTCEHFAAAGDDAHPLLEDYALAVEIPRSGGAAIAGYIDPNNAGVTLPGGKRIYSRNEDAEVQGQLWLKNDGENILSNLVASITQSPDGKLVIKNEVASITQSPDGKLVIKNEVGTITQSVDGSHEITNGAGTFTLESGGNIIINGVTFAPGGIVTGMKSLELNGKQIDGHLHGGVQSGGSSTGPNV